MSGVMYIRRDRKNLSHLKTWIIMILALILIASSSFLFFRWQQRQTAANMLAQFQTALDLAQYDQAIQIYREVQAKAIRPSEETDSNNQYGDILRTLETEIDQELDQIESQLSNGQSLTPDQRLYAAGLAEVSGLRLTRFVRELSRNYLIGHSDSRTLEQAIDELIELDNLKDPLRVLDDQINLLKQARPEIILAEQLLEQEQWLVAYEAWSNLASQTDRGPFVQDYTRERLDDCRQALYGPLLSAALSELSENRAVTARISLLKLQPIFPDDTAIKAALAECERLIPGKLTPYRGTVEHLTIKPLIISPSVAFDQDAYANAAYDTMLTTNEFKEILEQLYLNDYILVDQSRLLVESGQIFEIELPEGKRPLVLVLEGFNYYVTRRETGNCWNLVLNSEGQVCGEYQDTSGLMHQSRDAEAIGILDAFVEKHPDFSFDGAKGLITLTGYEGLFGYITDKDQLDDRNQALMGFGYPALELSEQDLAVQIKAVESIVQQLKKTGWQFGSSTYGFINCASASPDLIAQDWQKWQQQVGRFTGPVVSLQYPNGALLNQTDERYIYYRNQGIRIFGGLGAASYLIRDGDALYVDKCQISGYSLNNPELYRLDRLFDATSVLDRTGRQID